MLSDVLFSRNRFIHPHKKMILTYRQESFKKDPYPSTVKVSLTTNVANLSRRSYSRIDDLGCLATPLYTFIHTCIKAFFDEKCQLFKHTFTSITIKLPIYERIHTSI